MPEDRIAILKPQFILDAMEDDDTDVYSSNIIHRYSKRLRHQMLESLCLAEFAMWYDCLAKKYNTEDQSLLETSCDTSEQNSLPDKIKLIDGDGVMIKRKSPAIPRYHVFFVNKESERHFHQQLLLFFPWRDEQRDLKLSGDEQDFYEQKYNEVIKVIQDSKQQLDHHSDLVDQALND